MQRPYASPAPTPFTVCYLLFPMHKEELSAWLGLARALVLQGRQVQDALRRRGSATQLFFASREELEGDVPVSAIDRILEVQRSTDLDREAAMLETYDLRVLTWSDDAYPVLLKEIITPPPLLFYRGALPNTSRALVSMVGSRRATPYGHLVTKELVRPLVAHNIGVVSGLAFGIDEAAHRATLEQGGYTVAVLGGSLDAPCIVPQMHAALAQEIVDAGGCLLSEYPVGTKPQPFHFPIRNRIIAGLSPLTVVIEAAQKSGSLITAQIALEENRDVAAVPGPITQQTSRGTNQLIKDGAHAITGSDDLLGLLNLDQLDAAQQLSQAHTMDDLDRQIMDALARQPCDAVGLSQTCQIPAGDLIHRLTLLELKGLVQPVGSGYFVGKQLG